MRLLDPRPIDSLGVGAAVATLQDVVLPRMRATAGATYILGTTMVGLALGPYFAGQMADVFQSLRVGVFSLFIVPPFTVAALWIAGGRLAELEATKVERAREASSLVANGPTVTHRSPLAETTSEVRGDSPIEVPRTRRPSFVDVPETRSPLCSVASVIWFTNEKLTDTTSVRAMLVPANHSMVAPGAIRPNSPKLSGMLYR